MSGETLSGGPVRPAGNHLKTGLRDYGMLVSLVAIMLFFQVVTGGTLLRR